MTDRSGTGLDDPITIRGHGVAGGVAIGQAWVVHDDHPEVLEYALPEEHLEDEVARYRAALAETERHLLAVRERIPHTTPDEIADFIDTHLLMLRDFNLARAPEELIRTRRCNAEWALKTQCDTLISVFDAMEDPYLKTRKNDVMHIVMRVQKVLLEHSPVYAPGGSRTMAGQILIAPDLTPADTILMHQQGIAAFALEGGGPVSHTAILARSLGLPALTGVHAITDRVAHGDTVIIDGDNGVLIRHPDPATLAHYRQRQRSDEAHRIRLERLRDRAPLTRDDQHIALRANIELPSDLELATHVGADGIGLYRTEFFFMNREQPPSEEEQFETLAALVERLEGAPLTVRTLDLGADKTATGIGVGQSGNNPALGLRAIRLCLRDEALFRPQLAAALRASALGPLRLMIPMLSSLDEVTQTRRIFEEVKASLRERGEPFDEKMPLGGMIEVPAAALCARAFAEQLDFLSIGTNDLIQYTLAIDRLDDEVADLYDPLQPAVLQLIHTVIEAGRITGTPVAMCGEMAGEPRFTRLLLGLGLREFSVLPGALLRIKEIILESDCRALQAQASTVLGCSDREAIAAAVAAMDPRQRA